MKRQSDKQSAPRKNIFDLLHVDESQFAYEMIRGVSSSDNAQDIAFDAQPRNFRVQKKDGSFVWVEMRMCTDVRGLTSMPTVPSHVHVVISLPDVGCNFSQGELLYIVQRDITHIRVEVRLFWWLVTRAGASTPRTQRSQPRQ